MVKIRLIAEWYKRVSDESVYNYINWIAGFQYGLFFRFV